MRVGIDLGTTNSSIAYMNQEGKAEIIHNREGERTTPSVLLYEDGTFIVGTIAKEASMDDPMNTVQFVKRQIGNPNYKFLTEDGKEFTAEELSAVILKRLVEDAESFLNEKVTEAVITVPAYFNDSQRKATADAGAIAGLNVLKIINEPTAAAISYSEEDLSTDQHILIYDLGGGTFDITLVKVSEAEIRTLATDGIRSLGGFDFDNALLNHVLAEFNEEYGVEIDEDDEALQELREKTEAAKKTLSARNRANISLNFDGHRMKKVVTVEDFQNIIANLMERTRFVMEDLIDEVEMDWSDIHKILLVGGSTRMPFVA